MTNRTPRLARGLCLAALALASLQLLSFADTYAVNVLFWDEWDFGDAFFQRHSLWERFSWQHGPHRQGVGNLVLWVVWNASRWNIRAEVFVAVATLLIAAVLGLFLMRRFCGSLSAFDASVPLLYVSPAAWELLAVTPNPAHGSIPLLLVTAFALALFIDSLYLRLGVLLILDFLCTFTGFGLFLGPLAASLFVTNAWRCRSRKELLAYSVATGTACIVLLMYLRHYRLEPAVNCFVFPWSRPWEYLPFVGFVVGQPVGLLPGRAWRTGIATVLALMLIAGALAATRRMLRQRPPSPESSALFVLLGFSTLFCMNAAIGRICLGVGAGGSSRYSPYAVPALVAGLLYLQSQVRSSALRSFCLSGFLLMSSVPHFRTDGYRRQAEVFASGKRRWVQCFLARADTSLCERLTGFKMHPDSETSDLDGKLAYLRQRHLSIFASRPEAPTR